MRQLPDLSMSVASTAREARGSLRVSLASGTTHTSSCSLHLSRLDNADTVYNGIYRLIDKHIAEPGITAPAGTPYDQVWQPQMVATALDPAAAGGREYGPV